MQVQSFFFGVPLVAAVMAAVGVGEEGGGALVRGRVVDELGRGVAGAAVYAMPEPIRSCGRGDQVFVFDHSRDYVLEAVAVAGAASERVAVRSGEAGYFEFVKGDWIQPTLYVSAPGFEPAEVVLGDDGDGADGGGDSADGDIEVTLKAPALLFLQVVAPGSLAAVDIAVRRLIAEDSQLVSWSCGVVPLPQGLQVTDHRGRGEGVVCAIAVGVGSVANEIQINAPGYADFLHKSGGVEAGELGMITCSLVIESVVRGVVLDSEGDPVTGAEVRLTQSPRSKRQVLQYVDSLAGGVFEFRGLSEGVYGLYARMPTGEESQLHRVNSASSGSTLVEHVAIPAYVEGVFLLVDEHGIALGEEGDLVRVTPVSVREFSIFEQGPEFVWDRALGKGGVLHLRGPVGDKFEVSVGGRSAVVVLASDATEDALRTVLR